MKQAKVIIVDDEEQYTSTLVERLCLRKYNAKAATNVEEAISLIKRESPDVVFIDLMMPGMENMWAVNVIKEFNPSIKIVLISGDGSIQDIIDSEKAELFDTLVKPIDIDRIIQTITRAVNNDVTSEVLTEGIEKAHLSCEAKPKNTKKY